MKHTILVLFFGVFSVVAGLAQAEEPITTESHEPINNPNVFATVNGRPVGTNLYRFLLGSRQQEMAQREAFDDGFDSSQHRQQTARDLVMTELLAQQATRLGLDDTEVVRVELAMAEKTLLAQLYVQKLMSSIEIEEAEMRRYYDQQREQAMYRFLLWEVPDEERALEILDRLQTGNDAAARFPDAIETPWLRDTDIAPEVNERVRRLEVDEFLAEPVFQDGIWKVVQVIDKQIMVRRDYEEERELIRVELVNRKLNEKLDELAANASIVFSDQQLSRAMK